MIGDMVVISKLIEEKKNEPKMTQDKNIDNNEEEKNLEEEEIKYNELLEDYDFVNEFVRFLILNNKEFADRS